MQYKDYTYIDFIKDDFYISWVLQPGVETNLFWTRWMSNHPNKVTEMRKARNFILGISYGNQHELNDNDFDRLHENIIRFQNENQSRQPNNQFRKNKFFGLLIAAVVSLVIISGGFWLYNDLVELDTPKMVYLTTQTEAGVKQTIKLSDGTVVKINSASSIRYPEQFIGDFREVYLQGEAFFEVAENPNKPFIIHSKGFVTEVKGTSFNLKAYDDEPQKISVISGLVEVYAPGIEHTPVYPNQSATLNPDAKVFDIQKINPFYDIAWKDNILHFEQQELKKVFQQLEKWYGVEIIVKNESIISDIYQGEFQNESLENVLTGMSFTSGFQFAIDGKKVYIN